MKTPNKMTLKASNEYKHNNHTLKGEIETKVTVNKFPEVFYNNIWHNPWKPAEINQNKGKLTYNYNGKQNRYLDKIKLELTEQTKTATLF